MNTIGSVQLDEVLSTKTQNLLKKYGFKMTIVWDESAVEPFKDKGLTFLESYKSFEGKESESLSWHPVYKKEVQGHITYSSTPYLSQREYGFCGFLTREKNKCGEAQDFNFNQVIREQNNFIKNQPYSLLLLAKGFSGDHKQGCFNKGNNVEKTALEMIENTLEHVRLNTRLVRLTLVVTPSKAENQTSQDDVLATLREHCGLDMIVIDSHYDHQRNLIVDVASESIGPMKPFQQKHWEQDLKMLGVEYPANQPVKHILEVIRKYGDSREWDKKTINYFFRIALYSIPNLKIYSIAINDYKMDVTSRFVRTNIKTESNEDKSLSFVKFKTMQRLSTHGLKLRVKTDISTNETNTYLVSVKMDIDWFDAYLYGCKDENGEIDKVVNGLIDKVVSAIDKDDETKTLVFKVDNDKLKSKNLVALMSKNIEYMYGITPSIGSVDINKKRNELKIRMAFKSLPPFLKFLDLKERNIYVIVKNKMIELNEGGLFRKVDITPKLDLLISNAPYAAWDQMMMHAFMDTLLDNTEGVQYLKGYGFT